ncbi:MAG TPA: SCP-2 sterol transfer family protein [Spirochaetota bacterium]|nr:SCP-2 sterol transfer family protein [Spirochaetota bacterium]HOD13313.1 SCP-2 sterol transfer family protein [Spirochaetota bacterium]HPG49601.1 SCP-2 sterol transfer family protein [Spirochaetota bacterium]HPN11646.1 SCP-2 sterol transfer family protein [Spirochaetota bacterium]
MPKFLSDEWFAKVDELTKAAAGLEIPKAMKDVVVNLTVSTDGTDVPFSMNGGIIRKGPAAAADVEMSMPAEYALSILIKGDWSAGMKGWVARKIKVSGNMRKLIPLQVYKATASQESLRKQIESITEA